jgi:hypothetical protein
MADLTEPQKLINDDPAYWEHFQAWWAQDFSWDGLKNHKIENHPQGHNLQDYWREEEDKLIEFGGKTWTRFHLPMHDLEWEVSEKYGLTRGDWKQTKWNSWRYVVLLRLEAAGPLIFVPPEVPNSRGDTRAQFQGVCFPDCFDLSYYKDGYETGEEKDKCTLHLNACWSRFGKEAWFIQVIFGNFADFSNAYFGDFVAFLQASFGTQVMFDKAHIGKGADFSASVFQEGASFEFTQFGINVQFEGAVFGDGVTFDSSRFGWLSVFQSVQFGERSNFKNTQFGEKADFMGSTFGNRAAFDKACFGEKARFENVEFGPDCHFTQVEFDGNVTFLDATFGAQLRFNYTKFLGKAKFHNCNFHPDTSFADAEFAIPGKNDTEQAEKYESAFRVLRHHMETLRNHGQQMKFARLEMQARERRFGSSDVPLLVRSLSRGYGWVSDYGQSIGRPLLGLGLAMIIAAISYYTLAGASGHWDSAFLMAMQSSLPPVSNSVANFFGGFSDIAFLNALDAKPFITRTIMTVHGVFSITMVFLSLLAIRRRFQLG